MPLRWARAAVAVAFGVVGFGIAQVAQVALIAGTVVSVPLFSNQTQFTGVVAKAVPAVGDITFLVGFAVAAAVYVGLFFRATR